MKKKNKKILIFFSVISIFTLISMCKYIYVNLTPFIKYKQLLNIELSWKIKIPKPIDKEERLFTTRDNGNNFFGDGFEVVRLQYDEEGMNELNKSFVWHSYEYSLVEEMNEKASCYLRGDQKKEAEEVIKKIFNYPYSDIKYFLMKKDLSDRAYFILNLKTKELTIFVVYV